MSHSVQPMLINIPQPPSNPDTPSEMPGTPTSTTTSLSALSTTAIKDGHRGHALPTTSHRGHHHHGSTTSLEAERADRISRLTGLSGVNTLRPPPPGGHSGANASAQTTPTSGVAPAHVFFDANGQPTAVTKISTVGTASATESVGGRTLSGEGDEDVMSMDTNFGRGTEADSTSGYMTGAASAGGGADMMDGLDEDMADRSVGGFEDRMSDDGEASLVGFGEGAGSTVSGPIYHRRPLPTGSSTAAMIAAGAGAWNLERSSSGLSDARREMVIAQHRSGFGEGADTPVSVAAATERREARMVDGVATDGAAIAQAPAEDDMFVDTTTRSPVPVGPPVRMTTSALRETQQPSSYQHHVQQQQPPQFQQPASATSREALERLVRGLDDGESRVGNTALGSPGKGGASLGRFYFEDHK